MCVDCGAKFAERFLHIRLGAGSEGFGAEHPYSGIGIGWHGLKKSHESGAFAIQQILYIGRWFITRNIWGMTGMVEKSAIVLDGIATGMKEEAVKIQTLAGSLPVGPDEQQTLMRIANNLRGMAALIEAIVKDLRTVKGTTMKQITAIRSGRWCEPRRPQPAMCTTVVDAWRWFLERSASSVCLISPTFAQKSKVLHR